MLSLLVPVISKTISTLMWCYDIQVQKLLCKKEKKRFVEYQSDLLVINQHDLLGQKCGRFSGWGVTDI